MVEIHNQHLPEITESYLIGLHRDTQKPVSLVAEIKEVVVGYILYFIRQNRYEVIHLAIDESYYRCGIATVLINNLKLKLSPSQEIGPQKDIYNYSMQSPVRSKITVTVPDHLLNAHLFLRSCDFKGQITDNDSYRFEYKI
jgi:hypothetical protein